MRVWEACLIADTHAMKSLRVWEACLVADTHAVESLWVWETCFVADTHAMKSLRVWEACLVADTHAMESLRVWEACLVADTHAMESLRVWEAYSIADTQIVKTGRYNKRHILKCSSWAFCVLGLCRKNVLWDTKFAANNIQKGEYGSIGKKLALRYSSWRNWVSGRRIFRYRPILFSFCFLPVPKSTYREIYLL